jgi:hypothetical protein
MAADSTMFLTMNLFTALSFGTNAPLDSQNTLLTCVNVDEKISHESVSMEINGHKTSRRLCKAVMLFQNPLILGLNVNRRGAKTTLEIVHARKKSTRDR